MEGVNESRATANVRALAKFSVAGADGNMIAYGSKVALKEDKSATFFVAGWAVVQGRPIVVAEPEGSIRIGATDGIALLEPSRIVRVEQHEVVEIEFDASEAKLSPDVEGRDDVSREAQEKALSVGAYPGAVLKREGLDLVVQAIATGEHGPFAITSDESGEMVCIPLSSLDAEGSASNDR